jgi:hypothetical protein
VSLQADHAPFIVGRSQYEFNLAREKRKHRVLISAVLIGKFNLAYGSRCSETNILKMSKNSE